MTVYRDLRAPAGRVIFGGVAFVDGVTGDIEPGPNTRTLFAAAGVVPEEPAPEEPDPVEQSESGEQPTEPTKPARKRK